MKVVIETLSIILVILNLNFVNASYNYYDIVLLGAKPDSNFDSSKALKAACNLACDSSGESTIHIPEGEFFLKKSLTFSGKGCQSSKINFVVNGTIVAPSDFRVLQNSKTWVLFDHVNGVTLSGGVFDDIACDPDHDISIGRLEKTLHATSAFTNKENGVRIKSWGRPSDGFVSQVVFQHLTIENARNPIIIDQKYCPNNQNGPGEVSGVKISDVTYDDIHGSSAIELL
uniref:Uncharacterized protein n=1 Tax=Chenopodium quinoa TaxID=63459 RepID=A0A803KV40_CHEQI